jgi:hypothetical protein
LALAAFAILAAHLRPRGDRSPGARADTGPIPWFHPEARRPRWSPDQVVQLPDWSTARWGDVAGEFEPATSPRRTATLGCLDCHAEAAGAIASLRYEGACLQAAW